MSTIIRGGHQYASESLTGRMSGTFPSKAWVLAEHGRRRCGMSVSLRKTVLVAVEMHPNRNRAYLPRGDIRAPEGQAADYTDFLADQVLPQLRSRYRVASEPGATAIVGSSNGAIHALCAGLHRPETFS